MAEERMDTCIENSTMYIGISHIVGFATLAQCPKLVMTRWTLIVIGSAVYMRYTKQKTQFETLQVRTSVHRRQRRSMDRENR